jgi:hypothetical protein
MSLYDEYDIEPLGDEERLLLITMCVRCGQGPLMVDPDTCPSVVIHRVTRTPVGPDGREVRLGDRNTTREALCPACVQDYREAARTGSPVPWLVRRT